MLKILPIFFAFLLTFVLTAQDASAQLTTPSGKTFSLPSSAKKVSENVYNLGQAKDPKTGKEVEGFAFIHRKAPLIHYKNSEQFQRPSGGINKTAACYTYMGKGVKWKSNEPWYFNPTNTRNLDHSTVFSLLNNAITKWEDATNGNTTDGVGADILGNGTLTYEPLTADSDSLDNKNEVLFADITDSNAIGVTIVWGVWTGPASAKEIVEWDQVYDDVSYDWSTDLSSVSGKMDFDNIATHEIGHSFGMGDLYNSCVNETMYGYASEGEINKRDLNSGDISGINTLY